MGELETDVIRPAPQQCPDGLVDRDSHEIFVREHDWSRSQTSWEFWWVSWLFFFQAIKLLRVNKNFMLNYNLTVVFSETCIMSLNLVQLSIVSSKWYIHVVVNDLLIHNRIIHKLTTVN